jgi:hypothetical protein
MKQRKRERREGNKQGMKDGVGGGEGVQLNITKLLNLVHQQ